MQQASDYQEQAARTLIDGPDFEISDRDMMLIWSAIGLADEVGELQEVFVEFRYHGIHPSKLKDELGDVLWYLSAIYTKMELELNKVILSEISIRLFLSADDAMDRLVIDSGKVCGIVKKGVFHQHGIVLSDLEFYLDRCLWIVGWLCVRYGIDIGEVMAQNIEKLKVRYPDGYSAEDSKKRVDVT